MHATTATRQRRGPRLSRAERQATLGSPKGAKDVPKKRKTISRREAQTEPGRFALHLDALLAARGWSPGDFACVLTKAGLGHVKEHAVRAWLRADNMPKSHDLRAIGKALGLADPRHILPPD